MANLGANFVLPSHTGVTLPTVATVPYTPCTLYISMMIDCVYMYLYAHNTSMYTQWVSVDNSR